MTATGTGLILGQVIEANGNRSVSDVLVTLTGAGGARTVIAEAQGRFVFGDLAKGSFTMTTSKAGWVPGAYGRRRPEGIGLTIALEEGQRVTGVTIPMWRPASISGTVHDEFGDPLVGVEVRALAKTFRTGDARWMTAVVTTTDDRGVYRLSALVPGEYTVVVPSTQVAMFIVGGTNVIGPRIVTTSPSGEVISPMMPRQDTAIRVGDHLLSSTVPAASAADRTQPYAYSTTFYPNAVTSSEGTSMTLRSGDERAGVDFDLRPVRTYEVSGIVTGPNGPAPNTTMQLLRAAASPAGRMMAISDIDVSTTLSGPGGRFVFPAVPAGQFLLRASKLDTSASQTNPAAVRTSTKMPIAVGDADVTGLAIELQIGFTVSGRLEFAGSAPRPDLTRLQVTLEPLDPRDGETRQSRVTAEGTFSETSVSPADYMFRVPEPSPWILKTVMVGGRDMTDRAVEIGADLTNVVLTFSDERSEIRGHVTGTAGPDPGASVLLFPGGGFPLNELTWVNSSRRFKYVRVDAQGAYVLAAVPPGDYLVAAVPDEITANWTDTAFLTDLSRSATTIRVAEGDKKTQDLRTVQVRR